MTDPSAQRSYTPQFAPLPQSTGVRVIDSVEGVKFDLYTSRAVEPTPADPERLPFCYPVESAARISASELTTPTQLNVNIRDADGDLVASATNNGPVSVDDHGTYVLELSNTPIKLYVTVTSRVLVYPDEATTELVFPDADAFAVGARSFHKHPARTITTTAEPTDLMRAISEFGAALKTTSPERSFPTWRGHPPLLELGDSLDIPGGTRCPDTGVRIEVPPDLSYLYPVVPLAYYLGAEVRPGDTPRLLTGDGFEHPLATPPGFETSVARVLKHVFTLDCLARTEGHYDVCLDERERAHARGIDLDYATLYDAPLATRVARYLSVPFEDLEPVVPQWRLTADVTPAVKYADLLPYIAAELTVVRCPTTAETAPESTVSSRPDELTEFYRSGRDDTGADPEAESARPFAYPPCGSSAQVSADGGTWWETGTSHMADHDTHVRQDDIFRVEEAPTITQTYIGDGFPLGANKGSKAAYERRLSIRSNATSRIDVTVICNDSEMQRETAVGEVYGTRDLFEFDVTVHEELTKADLRDALQADTDFVHYIGHVDARGLQATDGFLDAHALDDVGARAFFLNACRSFRQGAALVNRGAVAGIATLENVHNSVATEVGHTVARLLNAGWPLDGALRLVQDDTIVGRHYIVVGDGLVELVTPDSGVPVVAHIDPRNGDTYNVTIETYPTRHRHLLTLFTPYISDNERRYLASGELDTFTVTSDELREFLSLGSFPIQFDSSPIDNRTLQWSDEVNVDAL